jgi:hypothetical protein
MRRCRKARAAADVLSVAVRRQQFNYFSLSYFVPHELARAELANPTVARIVSLPLVEMNMTSGHILSNNVHADARSADSINHDRTYDWSGTRRTP